MKKTITRIAPIIISLALTLILGSCGKVNTYSAKDLFDISVTGMDGYGKIKASLNKTMENRIIEESKPKNADDMTVVQYVILIETTEISFTPYENLKNGDTVTVTVKCNEKGLADKNIVFTDTTFTYTVGGLAEAREINPFEGAEVTFSGISPRAFAEVTYNGTEDFVKENVNFVLSKSGNLKNGEIINVKAVYNKYKADEQYIIITEEFREYPVEADRYLDTEIDFSELDKIFENKLKNTLDTSENYGVNSITQSRGFFKDGDAWNKYKVRKYSFGPVKEMLCYNPNTASKAVSTYAVFYKVNFEIEKAESPTGFYSGFDDGHEIGYVTESDDIYVCVYLNDMIVKTDGTTEYNTDNVKAEGYTVSLFGNFIGADFNDILKNFSQNINSGDVVYSKDR